MKYRPSRLFVVCLASLALTGAAGAWAWNKANSAPMHVRNQSSFWELLWHKEKSDFDRPTDAERAETRQQVLALKAELLAEFPELAITEMPVPDGENGFLQLFLMSGPPSYPNLELSREALDLISGKSDWNPELAEQLLEEHAEVVTEVERIAALDRRSSSGMPDSYTGFVSARAMKAATELLLTKARLSAEAGDEESALTHAASAQNIASHFREVETRNLLSETMVMLVDLAIQDCVLDHLLPLIGPDADLSRWMQVIKSREYSARSFAHTMRGEWATTVEYNLFPVLVNPDHENCPADASELARVITATYRDRVTSLESASHAELLEFDVRPTFHSKLSEKSRKILDIFYVGSATWSRGYVRVSILSARNRAVLELLEKEKSGEVLSAETMSRVTRDPLSGRPFDFDADRAPSRTAPTRTISTSSPPHCRGDPKHEIPPVSTVSLRDVCDPAGHRRRRHSATLQRRHHKYRRNWRPSEVSQLTQS